MKIQSNELEEYIRATLASITKGVDSDGSFRVQGVIVFDLVVTNTKEGKGGLKVYVANAAGKTKQEHVSRIKFSVKPYANETKGSRHKKI